MDDQTQIEALLTVVEQLVSNCADARDRGDELPDWLDELEDRAIDTLAAVSKES